jgi:hypothetical protein
MYHIAPATLSGFAQLAAPDGLLRLPHFQQVVDQDPADLKKVKRGKIVRLSPEQMNPGFISMRFGEPGSVVLDYGKNGLQPCLEKALAWHPLLLADDKPGIPSRCDRVRVALVNLTGSRWFTPDLALWGGTYPMEAASIGKLLAAYALFQLRFDLRVLAALKNATDRTKLITAARDHWGTAFRPAHHPALGELFAWDNWDGKPQTLAFSNRTRQRLDGALRCNDNCAVGRLMVQIGFPFIGSVALQSGLWEPTSRGGLWLSANFVGKSRVLTGCPPPESCAGVSRRWSENPVRAPKPLFPSNATALSVATFYTLLSQFRLPDPASSLEMMTLLAGGCVTTPFKQIITAKKLIAMKCGFLTTFKKRLHVYGCKDSRESVVTNDSALFIDSSVDPPLRYVIVIMAYVPRARVDWTPIPKDDDPIHYWDYRGLLRRLQSLCELKGEIGEAC